jgi:hypothetical protein
VACSCELGDEPFGSINGGEFVYDVDEWPLPSQEELCSMLLIR